MDKWIDRSSLPTLKQLEGFARTTGVPFGYFLLDEPPAWKLPVPDFREGFGTPPTPSADLIAVLGLAQRRQVWYREYALGHGAEPLPFVGSAADADPATAADSIRAVLDFDVPSRTGTWSDSRRALLKAFEDVGGLTVATSMVGNNTHRLLDEDEFRGFALVDDIAPLVFVNTQQTLNGQLFTLAHEFAHVWRGRSGIGNENPRCQGQSEIEQWCNAVASEVLVPSAELRERYQPQANLETTQLLDGLARDFKCGTLVILQALRRTGAREFADFDGTYDAEVQRLHGLAAAQPGSGGDHYNNQRSASGNAFLVP